MRTIFKIITLCGLLGVLAACTSTVRSDVSRFHTLPKPAGEKIIIVASDPEKNNSLEFASYASLVGNSLGQQGYVPADGAKADLIVELDYSVDDGKVMTRSSPSYFGFHRRSFGYYRYVYYGNRYYRYWYPYGYYSGHFGHDFHDRDVRSYVNYTRRLKMVIRSNREGAVNLYEGSVESVGRSKNLPEMMPFLVQALFTNFPGQSGSTEKIVIEKEQN